MATVETGQPAAEVLDSCRTLVEPALRAAIDSLAGPVRRIAGYHRGWWAPDGTPTTMPSGKAVRPALTVLAARNGGGRAETAVPAAVAVELVHDFSLLHDDVIDRDLTRRHRATAWAAFGAGPAILAGDALLTLAMDVLADCGGPEASRGAQILSAAVQELLDGQVADLAFERRSDVGLAECLRMTEQKTGALLGAACSLGALFGGGGPEQVSRMKLFGRQLGMAFQVVDDLLGIWGDPATTGKPVRNDLRTRKKSVPVVAALAQAGAPARELAALYAREGDLPEAELARAAELVELAGCRDWCRSRTEDWVASAMDLLPEGGPATAELRAVARLMTLRDH